MRRIEGHHDGRRIEIQIAVLRSDNPTDFSFEKGIALVDTGATCSGIGPRIVKALELNNIGKRPLGSATEERIMPFYVFRLGVLEEGDTSQALQVPTFPYIIGECVGFGWEMERQFDVILGMDILKKSKFHVDGPRWSIEFNAFNG